MSIIFVGEQWKCLNSLTDGHSRTIRYISWSNDGRFLASVSFDGTTCIWSQKNQENSNETGKDWTILVSLDGHENEIKSVAWSANDTFLATCSRDKSVWIWEKIEIENDIDTNLDISDRENVIFECSSVQNIHTQDVKCVKWHPKLDILVSAGFDNSIKFFHQSEDDWDCYADLNEHESTVWSIAFNREGTRLVSVSADETIKIWQPKSYNSLVNEINSITAKKYCELTQFWTIITSLSGYHRWPIYDVSWSNYLNVIITCGADNSFHLIKEFANNPEDVFSSVRYRQIEHKTDAHDQDINSIDWNQSEASNHLFATGSDDGLVKIWSFSEVTNE